MGYEIKIPDSALIKFKQSFAVCVMCMSYSYEY